MKLNGGGVRLVYILAEAPKHACTLASADRQTEREEAAEREGEIRATMVIDFPEIQREGQQGPSPQASAGLFHYRLRGTASSTDTQFISCSFTPPIAR